MTTSLWNILEPWVQLDVIVRRFLRPFWDTRKIALKSFWKMDLFDRIIGLIVKIRS